MIQAARERKFTVDTNLYIRALRDADAEAALGRFHIAFAPFEYLTSIVVLELRAGAPAGERRRLDRIFAPFERTRRVLAPSYSAWKDAGAIVAGLHERHAIQWSTVSRGFLNDVLLAVTCREAGVTLVTENIRDFDLIARVNTFDYVAPWPQPA